VSRQILCPWPDINYSLTVAVFFCGTPSLTYFTLLDLRLPFRRLLRLARSRWRFSIPPAHWDWSQWNELNWIELEIYITTDGQPPSLCWNKAPFCSFDQIVYCLTVWIELSESATYVMTDGQPACLSWNGFVDFGRPLWREAGSVFYNCCWPSPAQSFSGPSPLGLVAILYCLRFET
jgi:hypothetical protein